MVGSHSLIGIDVCFGGGGRRSFVHTLPQNVYSWRGGVRECDGGFAYEGTCEAFDVCNTRTLLCVVLYKYGAANHRGSSRAVVELV